MPSMEREGVFEVSIGIWAKLFVQPPQEAAFVGLDVVKQCCTFNIGYRSFRTWIVTMALSRLRLNFLKTSLQIGMCSNLVLLHVDLHPEHLRETLILVGPLHPFSQQQSLRTLAKRDRDVFR